MPGKGIVVAEVVGIRAHPNADFIRLVDLTTGDGRSRQVVFGGGRNPGLGDLVAYAPPGSRLHTGVKMRRRRYRGEWSHGMLCSTAELGWVAEGPKEIAVLRPGNVPGMSLDEVLYGEDWLDDRSRAAQAQMQAGLAAFREMLQRVFVDCDGLLHFDRAVDSRPAPDSVVLASGTEHALVS